MMRQLRQLCTYIQLYFWPGVHLVINVNVILKLLFEIFGDFKRNIIQSVTFVERLFIILLKK